MPTRANQRHDPARRSLPRWKKLFYGLVAAAVFLALLEGILAIAGVEPLTAKQDPFVGFDAALPHFEERAEIGEPPMLRTARNKLPYLNEQSFAVKKPPESYRIFCLGGSTTYGQPYDDPTSFVGWLRTILETAAPERYWEVVNAGGISYASYRVAALMEELVDCEPDLFIIYTGHNEFLEERTYRDVRAAAPALRRLTLVAAGTRIGAVMHGLFAPSLPTRPAALSADVETKLDRAVGPSSYERDDELRAQIVKHYEASLRRMVDLARAAGAKIAFVRPACNLRQCAPFKSQPDERLDDETRTAWQEHVDGGRERLDAGRYAEAVQEFDEALQFDDRAAELHYLRGQSLFALKEYDAAEKAFWRAVDEDVCPLRMTTDLLDAFDRVVEEQGVVVVDYRELLRESSLAQFGHPLLGSEYFLDHVHPTIEAHGKLAVEVATRLWETNLLPGEGDLSPATIDAATRRVYEQVDPIAHAHAEAELARVLYWAGKQQEAGPLALKALTTVTDDPRVWLIAGVYLHHSGQTDEATEHLQRAREMSPEDPRIQDALNSVKGRLED